MPAQDLALFRAWPRLRERLPRQAFIDEPTPVEPFELEGLGPGRAFVKRDDLSCPLYGGNKPRKLEFIIGHALERKATRLVTTGGIGSHHGLATTILGRAAGLDCTLVLVPQPETPEVMQTLALDAAHGAEIVRARGVVTAALETAGVLARSTLRMERPFLVPTGGSSVVGNLGYVCAALELAEQISHGALPRPVEIHLPIGSGGTIAGLAAGLALARLEIQLRGALVTDILPPTAHRLARMANATLAHLRALEPAIPSTRLSASDFAINASELGAGYGAPTPGAKAAYAVAAEQGLELDLSYSAKCFAALRARTRAGALRDGPILFWNTHNSVAL